MYRDGDKDGVVLSSDLIASEANTAVVETPRPHIYQILR